MNELKKLKKELDKNNIDAEYGNGIVKVDKASMFIKIKDGEYTIQEAGEIPDKFGLETKKEISGVVEFVKTV